MAGARGFEPRPAVPKTAVLPLDDAPRPLLSYADTGDIVNTFYSDGCIRRPTNRRAKDELILLGVDLPNLVRGCRGSGGRSFFRRSAKDAFSVSPSLVPMTAAFNPWVYSWLPPVGG